MWVLLKLPRFDLRRLLASTFPAGDLLVFIPWRVVAAESGTATSAARAARPARAADFVLVELLVADAGRRWSSGGRAVRSYGVDPLRRRAIDKLLGSLARAREGVKMVRRVDPARRKFRSAHTPECMQGASLIGGVSGEDPIETLTRMLRAGRDEADPTG